SMTTNDQTPTSLNKAGRRSNRPKRPPVRRQQRPGRRRDASRRRGGEGRRMANEFDLPPPCPSSPARKKTPQWVWIATAIAMPALLVPMCCGGFCILGAVVGHKTDQNKPKGKVAVVRPLGPAEGPDTVMFHGIECPVVVPLPCQATYNGL